MWSKESDKIITINALLEEVKNGQSLLEFLQANANKQGGATLISFTIDGTSYQAEDGMTWAQWVNSSYNTGGFTVNVGDNTIRNGTNYLYTSSNMQLVSSSNTVISGGTYTFASGGAGN